MKKTLSFVVLAGLFLTVGCATANTDTTTSAANTPITLDQAFEKAEQTREQLQQAKTAYTNVKAAAQASKANSSNFETELLKQTVQTKVNNTKQQINNEIQDWKNLLAD